MEIKFITEGMACSKCEARVVEKLSSMAGVNAVTAKAADGDCTQFAWSAKANWRVALSRRSLVSGCTRWCETKVSTERKQKFLFAYGAKH